MVQTAHISALKLTRLRITLSGTVQGVGFRPFVYRLALELGLKGWVSNSMGGVAIELEGLKERLEIFLKRLENERPAHVSFENLQSCFMEAAGYTCFEIRESELKGRKTALVLPDIATCPECLKEIFDPQNRRYLYPFTNCTHCGPRFTIIEVLPYDRANTTMKDFIMCKECEAEYSDPLNRRFHAQPNACPVCGPQLEIWDESGKVIAKNHDTIHKAAELVKDGGILALKGVGGFQLIADAGNNNAVERLRQRKHREEKPFALMFPSLLQAKKICDIGENEEGLLVSSEAPIVLLKRKNSVCGIAPLVAVGNPYLGVILPYSPLHHILMRELGFPVVATSGNLSDEPICTEEKEALKRLSGIANLFLVHNRGIARHMDDSVVKIVAKRPLMLRRARGYSPLPIAVQAEMPVILALGAQLKNTVAMNVGNNVFVSQHLGDLETSESFSAFEKTVKDFPRLYECSPKFVSCDAHPDYFSTKFCNDNDIEVVKIQHHYAHVVSCMAENKLSDTVLGVSWDGTGFGNDKTIWGGEFLISTLSSFKRAGHLRTFRLPGGEAAIREPRRAALGVLYEVFGEDLFTKKDIIPLRFFKAEELKIMSKMLSSKVNAPLTSSAGRLFDAVSSLLGLYQRTTFEGQAAMALEFLCCGKNAQAHYPFSIIRNFSGAEEQETFILDWAPMITAILDDIKGNKEFSLISSRFHRTLAEMILMMSKRIMDAPGFSQDFKNQKKIVLSGGCFQNKCLTEKTISRLGEEGFEVYWHKDVPPNDGGISLGQAVAAHYNLKERKLCA